MNNNSGIDPNSRRRDIVTPAQRKAEQEKKLRAKQAEQSKKLSTEKAEHERQAQLRDARRREIENRRRNTSDSPQTKTSAGASAKSPHGDPRTTVNNITRKSAPRTSSTTDRKLYEQQQKLLEQQKQIKMLEQQIQREKHQRSLQSDKQQKLRELKNKLNHLKLVEESYLNDSSDTFGFLKSKNAKNAAVAVIALLVIANIIVFAKLSRNSVPTQPAPTDAVTDKAQTAPAGEGNVTEPNNADKTDPNSERISVATSDNVRGTVVLVNEDNSYNFEYTGKDIPEDELIVVASNIKNKTFKAADYRILLNRETVDMLNVMMADFYAYSGKNDVMVNTAHRTHEQQQAIYESKQDTLGEDQKIAQTPGNSEHHTGYAFDFSIYPDGGVGARTFTNEAEYTWIYENCHKYGFILRYPEGKTGITGIDPESWHFRYVGIPHSIYMQQKNKTLEEYMTDISIYSDKIPLKISVSDTESYSVFYVPGSTGARTEFNVPKNTEYTISGSNTGGFIVWYRNEDVGKKGQVQSGAEDTSEAASANEVQ